jgi:hypothetical protein
MVGGLPDIGVNKRFGPATEARAIVLRDSE